MSSIRDSFNKNSRVFSNLQSFPDYIENTHLKHFLGMKIYSGSVTNKILEKQMGIEYYGQKKIAGSLNRDADVTADNH